MELLMLLLPAVDTTDAVDATEADAAAAAAYLEKAGAVQHSGLLLPAEGN